MMVGMEGSPLYLIRWACGMCRTLNAHSIIEKPERNCNGSEGQLVGRRLHGSGDFANPQLFNSEQSRIENSDHSACNIGTALVCGVANGVAAFFRKFPQERPPWVAPGAQHTTKFHRSGRITPGAFMAMHYSMPPQVERASRRDLMLVSPLSHRPNGHP